MDGAKLGSNVPNQSEAGAVIAAPDPLVFTAHVRAEKERVMEELRRRWRNKPQMLPPRGFGGGCMIGGVGYVEYARPMVVQEILRAEIGCAIFVTLEQIDARGNDPQMRFELFLVTERHTKAKSVAREHAYDSEGGALLRVIELADGDIRIQTSKGEQHILLS